MGGSALVAINNMNQPGFNAGLFLVVIGILVIILVVAATVYAAVRPRTNRRIVITNKIAGLEVEKVMIERDMKNYPPGSLGRERRELAMRMRDAEIAVLRVLRDASN